VNSARASTCCCYFSDLRLLKVKCALKLVFQCLISEMCFTSFCLLLIEIVVGVIQGVDLKNPVVHIL